MPKFEKYTKKPVTILAAQINTEADARTFPPICTGGRTCRDPSLPEDSWPHIHTLEGTFSWTKGDYLIQGIEGEHYFCKPDIFDKSYNFG